MTGAAGGRATRWLREALSCAAVGLVAVVSSIVVPAAVITFHAMFTRDADAIARFARSVAEPLALVAMAAVVYVSAARTTPRAPRPFGRGTAYGAASALGVIGAAVWTGDVDGWTWAATLFVPSIGMLGAARTRRAARRSRGDRRAMSGRPGDCASRRVDVLYRQTSMDI